MHRTSGDPAERDRYQLAPDVILLPLEDGTAQLVDLDGSCFGLSETAARMLRGTLGSGEGETIRRIAAEYNADPETIRTDLTTLLENLRARGLIRQSDDRLTRPGLAALFALTISYPMLKIMAPVHNPRLKAVPLLAIARLCFVLAGWARTVEVWQKCVKLPPRAHGSEREQVIGAIDDATRRMKTGPASISCKERALCCWFMLQCAGVPAKLIMGVRFHPFAGHCWCEVDDRILTDSAEYCRSYTPLICYRG